MAYEPGGYADKLGNRYEGRWVVRQLLHLLHEQLRSVTLEAVGDDEAGVDLWVERTDGRREGQQCKGRNGSKSDWSFADLSRRGILEHAKGHLNRSPDHDFALVSAVPASWLRDLSQSARDSPGDAESFYEHQIAAVGTSRQRAFADLCERLELDAETTAGRAAAFDFLCRVRLHLVPDERNAEDELRLLASTSVAAEPDVVIAALADYAQQNLRKTLIAADLLQHLEKVGMQVRRLVADNRVTLRIDELRQDFLESIRPKLAAGRLISRPEADTVLDLLVAGESPEVVILHGAAGRGKSGVLYRVAEILSQRGMPYIALRLDRKSPRSSPRQFGIELGLPDSPAVCLEQLAAGRRGVLILDQLDALRWTSAHSAEGLDVCQALLREVQSLRSIGCELSVIIACRTFDLRNDPQIRPWLRADSPRRFHQVEVQELPEAAVQEIVDECGVSAGRLSGRRRSLLRTVQNLAMWTEIVRSGEPSPDFDSATGLMREFWRNRRREMEKAGISPGERDALLDALVDHMEQHATMSAPVRLVRQPEKLATELQTLGVIQVSGRAVTFCHQSYLDFLVADRAAEQILAGTRSVCDWLGGRSQQSLFRREQLRQLLFLLADEDVDCFVGTVRELLAHPAVRFHIKQLTLDVLGEATPNDIIVELVVELVQVEAWRDLILSLVVWGEPRYVDALAEQGLLQQWLSSGVTQRENATLRLLGSVADRCAPLVADLCRPLLVSNEENWRRRVEMVLLHSEPQSEPDVLFELRVTCACAGDDRMHVHWQQLAEQSPMRTFQLLAACMVNLPARSRDRFSGSVPLAVDNSDDWRAVVRAAACIPEVAWQFLLPVLARLVRQRRRQRAEERTGRPVSAWQDRLQVPGILIAVLRAAGRNIARRSPEDFLRRVRSVERIRSRIARQLLVACHAALPAAYSDVAVRWLLEDPRRFSCGGGFHRPKWLPARRLIAGQSRHCSSEAFAELEQAILTYRDPGERRLASRWLGSTRHGCFQDGFGAAQYFLLPALDPARRSVETIGRIGVLTRKFEDRGEEFFCHRPFLGGGISSPIGLSRYERLSDRAWLRLISNSEIPRRNGRWRRVRDQSGELTESSAEMFSDDLHRAAVREPRRFARLALRIPVYAPPTYMTAILRALQQQSPVAEMSDDRRAAPASAEDVQAVLDRALIGTGREVASEYCRLVARRDDVELSPAVLERLLGFVGHSDPDDELAADGSEGTSEREVRDFEVNANNSVRALAARAIAALVFRQPDLLERLRPAIERLLDDRHPAVRVAAAGICLPIWKTDRDLAVQWLIRAAASDERVGACGSARTLYNLAFPSHAGVLRPLIRRMIASMRDDVAEAGAAQVTARWVFFGLFTKELERSRDGLPAHRKGVAEVAAELVSNPKYAERCRLLLVPYFDDPDEAVRQQVLKVHFDRIMGVPNIASFLRQFVGTRAFRDDPTNLLQALKQFPGSLLPLSDVVFDVCSYLCEDHGLDEPGVSDRMDYAGQQVSPLLLRLYEQSEGPDGESIRQRCLDAWDSLLEHRVGIAWSFTRQLDQ